MLWLGMTRCLLRAAYVYVRLLGSNIKRERERERERMVDLREGIRNPRRRSANNKLRKKQSSE